MYTRLRIEFVKKETPNNMYFIYDIFNKFSIRNHPHVANTAIMCKTIVSNRFMNVRPFYTRRYITC